MESSNNDQPERFILLCMPRSGSTALKEIMDVNTNISFGVGSPEFLNGDVYTLQNSEDEVLAYLEDKLKHHKEKKEKIKAVGFKVFPEHLRDCNLQLDTLVRYLNIKHIFVLWREDTLSCLVSKMIAFKTGEWYKTIETEHQESHIFQPEHLEEYIDDLQACWKSIFQQWPRGIKPLFITYESLFADQSATTKLILDKLGLEICGWEKPFSKKQNPGTLEEKVSNWSTFPKKLTTFHLDLPQLFEQTRQSSEKNN